MNRVDKPVVYKKKRKSLKQFIRKATYRCQKDKRHSENDVTETEEYLLNVLRMNPNDFESPDEKEIYCSNVFREIDGKEVELSCSRIGSATMEKLLPFADKKILLKLSRVFSLDLRSLIQDKYGSHVLQRLISVVSNCVGEACEESDVEECLRSWLLQMSTYAVNNLEAFTPNVYANQVMREVVTCASKFPAKGKKETTDAEFATLVERFAEQVMKLPDIADFPFDSLRSGLLQVCLRALSVVNNKQARNMAKQLLKRSFPPICSEEGELPEVYLTESGSRLLDAIIEVAAKKLRVKLHAEYFKNNLKMLSLAPNVNFCVQNFISKCTDNAQFESMFDELSDHFEAILRRRHSGVILALASACERLRLRQGAFIKALAGALHCPESGQEELFALLTLRLISLEAWTEESQVAVSLHGSLILQAMLRFNKPVKVVKSIMALELRFLEVILCDPRGSHIADAFVEGQAVGEKNKERLLLKLKGSMVRLAVSPHGGRALEALFNKASVAVRRAVAEELAPNLAVINGCQCGSFLVMRFALELFRRNPAQWEVVQRRGSKALLLDELGEPKTKKKKKD